MLLCNTVPVMVKIWHNLLMAKKKAPSNSLRYLVSQCTKVALLKHQTTFIVATYIDNVLVG